MELRHLRYFVAVAEDLNMHRAAERLHISQPPLSLTIRQLEEEIGAPLFDRIGRGIALTRPGEIFLDHARRILADAETAKRATRLAGQGKAGCLKVGFISSAVTGILQKTIDLYKKRHPGVSLDIRQCVNGLAAKQILDGEFDVALMRWPEYLPETLASRILTKDSWAIAIPHGHPLAQKKIVSVKDLKRTPLIFYPRYNNPAGYDQVHELFKQHDVDLSIYQEAPEQMTIAALVASGMGIGIVPSCMEHLQIAGVAHRTLKEGKHKTGFSITYKKDRTDVLIQEFIKASTEACIHFKNHQ